MKNTRLPKTMNFMLIIFFICLLINSKNTGAKGRSTIPISFEKRERKDVKAKTDTYRRIFRRFNVDDSLKMIRREIKRNNVAHKSNWQLIQKYVSDDQGKIIKIPDAIKKAFFCFSNNKYASFPTSNELAKCNALETMTNPKGAVLPNIKYCIFNRTKATGR